MTPYGMLDVSVWSNLKVQQIGALGQLFLTAYVIAKQEFAY